MVDEHGWFHVEIWAYGGWLPGDPRGFRSKEHRVHSTGDYRNPPPVWEHRGLYDAAKQAVRGRAISFTSDQRPLIGTLCVKWCETQSVGLLAVAVGQRHGHLFMNLPLAETDRTVGRMKRYVSREAGRADERLRGQIFAKSGEPRRVETRGHAHRLMPYIVDKHAAEGAWTWSDPERFARLIGR